jgi:hypothetical protein
MGRKIHTNGWTGYKGDVNDGHTYYDEYLGKESMQRTLME